MVRTAHTENLTKKPMIFTSTQTNRHQSLNKFYDQLKKDSQLCNHQKIYFRSQAFIMKNAYKTVDVKLTYNIKNQKKTI